MKKIQLSIPEPCQQDWDTMTPTQQGRFCNACSKQVIDFSEMNDSEVLGYFSKLKDEKVCGRAFPDQLNRTISAQPEKKLYWYWNYIVAFILFFGKPGKSRAQTLGEMRLPLTGDTVFSRSIVGEPVKKKTVKKNSISGIIKDEHGEVIPFASVRPVGSKHGAIADKAGRFKIKVKECDPVLEISAVNHNTKRLMVKNGIDDSIILTKTNQLMEEVVVTSYSSYRMGGMAGGIHVCRSERRRPIKDTIQKWISNFNPAIKIYPNPVVRGSAFTVDLKLKQSGTYTMQVTDAAGRIVEGRKINAASKRYNEQLSVSNSWSSGIYNIHIIDDRGRSVGTERFAVQ